MRCEGPFKGAIVALLVVSAALELFLSFLAGASGFEEPVKNHGQRGPMFSRETSVSVLLGVLRAAELYDV